MIRDTDRWPVPVALRWILAMSLSLWVLIGGAAHWLVF